MSTTLPDVMTSTQAANYLQVDRVTLYRYIKQGRLIASSIGGAYRIPKRNLDLFLVASSSRPEIVLREYSTDQVCAFLSDDALDPPARAIKQRVEESLKHR